MSTSAPTVSKVVADAVAAVERFLAPALQERDSTRSITEKIAFPKSDQSTPRPADTERRQVIQEACVLLKSINEAVTADQTDAGSTGAYDSSLLSAVYNLLDLLILEGIYPALPVGVGSPVERRAKSLLFRKPDPSYVPPTDLGVVGLVLADTLDAIASKFEAGIEPMQRHRVLNDLIAANIWWDWSQQAISPQTEFSEYLDR
jgi:hypothetical protein